MAESEDNTASDPVRPISGGMLLAGLFGGLASLVVLFGFVLILKLTTGYSLRVVFGNSQLATALFMLAVPVAGFAFGACRMCALLDGVVNIVETCFELLETLHWTQYIEHTALFRCFCLGAAASAAGIYIYIY